MGRWGFGRALGGGALGVLALLMGGPGAARAQDFDRMSDVERRHYEHFQTHLIGRAPGLDDFERAYDFILPLYTEYPLSEAYRICYAQAISGFPASSEHAPLHLRALEALAGFEPEAFGLSSHLAVLLMNLAERLSEDRALLIPATLADPEVRGAFLRLDCVAAAIFATSLETGLWHQVKPGSDDWSIRPGMSERRAALAALAAADRAALPDWEAMERAAWMPEVERAVAVLGPVLADPRRFRGESERP